MGHHYLPREYLRGFAEPGSEDWIYQYYKKAEKVSRIRIRDAAQEKSFYPDEIETYLAQTIEGPANTVLKKLREGKAITPKDKTTLTIYIIELGSRVPVVRESITEVAPNVVDSVVKEMEEEIVRAVAQEPTLASRAEDQHKELLQFSEIFRKGPEAWHAFLLGEKPKSVAALSLMNWAFMVSDENNFVTSDNPVFLESGFGKPEGGLSLPLSSSVALFASWTLRSVDLIVHVAPRRVCKEVNRRTIASAGEYVYHRSNSEWLRKLVSKPNLRLCPIRLI